MTPNPIVPGIGDGQRSGWKNRKYDQQGNVVEEDGVRLDGKPAPAKAPSVHVRFRPHESYQWPRAAAEFAGCPFEEGCTIVQTEAQLEKLHAWGNAHGMGAHWKEH